MDADIEDMIEPALFGHIEDVLKAESGLSRRQRKAMEFEHQRTKQAIKTDAARLEQLREMKALSDALGVTPPPC